MLKTFFYTSAIAILASFGISANEEPLNKFISNQERYSEERLTCEEEKCECEKEEEQDKNVACRCRDKKVFFLTATNDPVEQSLENQPGDQLA